MTDLKILAETCRNVASLCTGADQMQRRDHMLEIAEILDAAGGIGDKMETRGYRMTVRESDLNEPPPYDYILDKRNQLG